MDVIDHPRSPSPNEMEIIEHRMDEIDHLRSPSPIDMEIVETNDIDDHPKLQRIWEVTKIGSFDADSWNTIFKKLSDSDLANVAIVCKDFQKMASNIMANRYKGHKRFCMSFANIEWKPIICRFGNVITNIEVCGAANTEILQKDFSYFCNFLCETLTKLSYYRITAKQLKNVVIQKQFQQLEQITFVSCNFNSDCRLVTHMYHWYPNLKSLCFSQCYLGRSKFLEREPSLPLVENIHFHFYGGKNIDFFLIFMVKNRQLKHIDLNLPSFPLAEIMSRLPIVNELLTNLESLALSCSSLKHLPTFRKNFDNVKRLGFDLKYLGTYKNEILRIINYFPMLEDLKIVHISQNLMTNDDLIDLLSQSSCTLKHVIFVSRGSEIALQFSYDLHRNVCKATSNRSDICIELEFDSPFNTQSYVITKESIKENENFIVIGGGNRN